MSGNRIVSYTVAPDYSLIIERLAEILEADSVLFPGGGNDLLNKVYRYLPPIPENPDTGIGPPHAFITTPERALLGREQLGRDTRDAKGIERQEIEFWVVVVTLDPLGGKVDSEKKAYALVSAVKTAFNKNIRLLDPATSLDASRLASTIEVFDLPFALNTVEKSIVARNIVVRVKLETKFT